MPTSHSFKIVVEYSRLNELNAKTTSTLYTSATCADLAMVLHALDESAAVASFSVFNTVTVPTLHNLGKLTAQDLGILDLVKLK